ncbi:MAG: protein-L-isoaspartate(D-aspartate) O-methyltransferase [Pseudomonadota bacterium]|nr:protein-L-isoaspartate(D-aspartate) O-methyltransferase [Pseudomonadota bacterium]
MSRVAGSPAQPQRSVRQAVLPPRSCGTRSAGAVILITALRLGLAPSTHADRYATQRAGMVQLIRQDVIDTSRYIGKEQLDPAVMSVMGRVPRHEFVPESERARAYANQPLAIGHGQTISQPYIVALMTDLLELNTADQVLEVGTGSGYQAAVLAELTRTVYTIEIIEPLGRAATARLARLGYANIHGRVGDGYYGWKEQAPFDAIIVTAAASHVPPPLLKQLRPGGRMIIPVGSRFMVQDLLLIEKSPTGEFAVQQILPVRFVPLTGEH